MAVSGRRQTAASNWTPLTDNQASLASGAIAIDPSNPDTIYVGTGEENFVGRQLLWRGDSEIDRCGRHVD